MPPRRLITLTTDFGLADHFVGVMKGVILSINPEAELVELVWMPLARAKELDMPAVTSVMLEELDARIADGFAHELPVPFYSMPHGRFRREML